MVNAGTGVINIQNAKGILYGFLHVEIAAIDQCRKLVLLVGVLDQGKRKFNGVKLRRIADIEDEINVVVDANPFDGFGSVYVQLVHKYGKLGPRVVLDQKLNVVPEKLLINCIGVDRDHLKSTFV